MSSRLVFWAVAAVWLLALSGCGSLAPVMGPARETSTRKASQDQEYGYLQFTNITTGHWIFVEGKPMGIGYHPASRQMLVLPAGPYTVEIIGGGVTVLRERVLVVAGSTQEIALK